MAFERFEVCARAYGAGRARWPEEDRPLYDRFSQSPEGVAVLAEAERTDCFLDALSEPQATPEFVARVAGRARARQRPSRRPLLWSGAVFAASAVFGFAVGLSQGHVAQGADPVATLILGPATPQEMAP